MQVQVRHTTVEDHPLLASLYHLYIHDLSAFTDHYQLDDRGQWRPDYLSWWLGDAECTHRLIIQVAGRPAGLAFVGRTPFPYMSPDRDLRLAEFFVLKSLRGQGVGRLAARALFDLLPGRWEVEELEANIAAVRFWRRVISEYTDGRFEERTGHGGPMQWFDNIDPG